MKNLRLNYLIVGGFVIAVLIGLVVSTALLAGRTGPTDPYHAIYGNVAGVEFGTRVLFEGYPVGQVERVTPVDDDGKTRFRVDMSVIDGWKIPEDTVAEIASSGLLAAVTVSLNAGDSGLYLEPGARIRSREAANVMVAVNDLAREIKEVTERDVRPMIAKISAVLSGVGELLGSAGPGGADDLRGVVERIAKAAPDIVDNINTFSGSLSRSAEQLDLLMSDENVKTIDGIIANLSTSSQNMNELTVQLGETRASLDGLLGNVDRMMGDLKTMMADNKLDVERSIIDMRHSVETVSRHIEAINQNLEGASRNMYEFSRQIRLNPGLLLGGTPPADNAREN